MEQFYVYIILSASCNKYYVGQTHNLQIRIWEHNNGKGGAFTSKHGPWRLMYHEIFKSRVEVLAREKEIKKRRVENILNGL